MKKVVLLFALVLMSAGALKGMEPEDFNPTMWGNLPDPVGRFEIIKNIKPFLTMIVQQSGDDFGSFLQKIIKDPGSIFVNKKLYELVMENLAGFTLFVHMLADKFDANTETVAMQFNTPVAKMYTNLGVELMDQARKGNIDAATELINEGADVNYTSCTSFGIGDSGLNSVHYDSISPLTFAVVFAKPKMVELLLNAGAKQKSDYYYESHGYLTIYSGYGITQDDIDQTKQLIKEANQ